jgi:hypothetical protein
MLVGGGAVMVIALSVFIFDNVNKAAHNAATQTAAVAASNTCQLKPFRKAQAEELMKSGAILAYERNGGSNCVDELYGIFPGGRIVGDNGTQVIEKLATTTEVETLLTDITSRGWFTEEMYSTSHTPCGQCYSYYLNIYYQGQQKTVLAVDGGTDAPANYWQIVSLINGLVPKFSSNP